MSDNNAVDIYKNLLAQISAEVYWDGSNKDVISKKQAYILGANHYSYFNVVGRTIEENDTVKPPFSATQSTENMFSYFEETWELVDDRPNRKSGFSAVLLKNKQSGEYTLSFRSTESKEEKYGGDRDRDAAFGADGSIVKTGFAFAQISDMMEYYEELKSEFLPSNAKLNITGYSLGGHLAQVFTQMYYGDVNKTMTFNGAGMGLVDDLQGQTLGTRLHEIMSLYDSIMSNPHDYLDDLSESTVSSIFFNIVGGAVAATKSQMLDTIVAAHNQLLATEIDPSDINIYDSPLYELAYETVDNQTSGTAFTKVFGKDEIIDDPKIFNFYGHATSGDDEVVAGSGIQYGTYESIFIEDQPNYTGGDILDFPFGDTHSITLIVDSLALSSLLQKLDSTLTLTSINESLFPSGSNEIASTGLDYDQSEANSLENILNPLGELFFDDWEASGVDGSQFGFADLENRNKFHDNVNDLRVEFENRYPEGEGAPSLTVLSDLSAEEMADLAKINIGMRYALHNLNPFSLDGDSSLYNSTTYSVDNFSPEYLQKRAEFLSHILQRNSTDTPSDEVINDGGEKRYFVDYDAGYAKNEEVYLNGSDLNNTSLIKFADDSGMNLVGSTESDYLFGSAGSDTLLGSIGNDHLEGGAGNDTYRYDAGDGLDTIVDAEGVNQIIIDGITLNGDKGTFIQSQANSTVYGQYDESGELVWDYIINKVLDPITGKTTLYFNKTVINDGDDGRLIIKGWSEENHFGLTLVEADAATTDAGNQDVSTKLNKVTNQEYTQIYGGDDDNYIDGSAGQRVLEGEKGNDVLIGGAGVDLINGGAGNDQLYAGQKSDLEAILTGTESNEVSSQDWLNGGDGDDLLVGSTGTEGLSGGLGNDVIYGGKGRDYLFGDWSMIATHYEWQVIESIQSGDLPDDEYTEYFFEAVGIGSAISSGDMLVHGHNFNGHDVLYGGDGDDYIFAGGGKDVVDGGNDHDEIMGGAGADLLKGGEGNDKIDGDDRDAATRFDYGDDILDGGSGNDELSGNGGEDTINGGIGDDTIWGDWWVLDSQHHGQDTLYGGDGLDTLMGHGESDYLYGGNGKDSLFGDTGVNHASDAGDDYLYGEGGDDYLSGDGGDDYLVGGAGNDDLLGGNGNDTYLYHLGDGSDAILDTDGNNQLLLAGINASQITLIEQSGNDYYLVLSDGAQLSLLNGTKAKTNIFLSTGNNIANALELETDNIAHHVISSQDNDVLSGGDASDTFQIDANSGQDTLSMNVDGQGVDKIIIAGESREGDWFRVNETDMRYDFDNGTGTILFENMFAEGVDDFSILFHIGSGWSYSRDELWQSYYIGTNASYESPYAKTAGNDIYYARGGYDLVYGLEGNDTLFGEDGNDELVGNAGKDTLYGGNDDDQLEGNENNDVINGGKGDDDLVGGVYDQYTKRHSTTQAHGGDDTYQFSLGDGTDLLIDDGGFDTIVFDNTVDSKSLNLIWDENLNLEIHYGDDGDSIKVVDFWGSGHAIESIQFENGDTLNFDQIIELSNQDPIDSAIDGVFVGDEKNDEFYNREGDDTFVGRGGENTHHFSLGDGADRIVSQGQGNNTPAKIILNFDNNISAFQTGLQLIDFESADDSYLKIMYSNSDFVVIENIRWIYEEAIPLEINFHDAINFTIDYQLLFDKQNTPTNLNDIITAFPDSPNIINALKGDDTITGDASDDILRGGLGDDRLLGGDGTNELYGDAGDDVLIGESGINTLVGGLDNDVLISGDGNDILIYHLGDGNDSMSLNNGDTIRLGQTISVDDLIVSRFDRNLIINFENNDGEIKLVNFYDGRTTSTHLNTEITVEFTSQPDINLTSSELSSLDSNTITNQSDIINYSDDFNHIIDAQAGDDHVTGGSKDDWLYGNTGDDILEGLSGTDTLEGGSGEDTLLGGIDRDYLDGGNDNDVLYGGSGNDTLFGQWGDDTLYGNDDNDSLTGSKGADTLFGNNGDDKLFGEDQNDQLEGGDGDDYLYGGSGDDIYYGGLGDDHIEDTDGANTYHYSRGEGHDRIKAYGGLSTLILEDLNINDISASYINKVGSHLSIQIDNTTTQSITIDNPQHISSFIFQNGDSLTLEQLTSDSDMINNKNNRIALTSHQESIVEGFGGNDYIGGSSGSDTIRGGIGNDVMNGFAGADTYLFRHGDGVDRIYGDSLDVLVFEDINYSEVQFVIDYEKYGTDKVVIEVLGGNDAILFPGLSLNSPGTVDNLLFADRTTPTDYDSLVKKGVTVRGSGSGIFSGGRYYNNSDYSDTFLGTDQDEYFYGQIGKDTFFAGDGHDVITTSGNFGGDTFYGQGGNDTITASSLALFNSNHFYGGAGDDIMSGAVSISDNMSSSRDYYYFSQGDGTDTIIDSLFEGAFQIVFDSSVDKNTVIFTQLRDKLVIGYGNNDEIHIDGFFDNDTGLAIDSVSGIIKYSDNSTLSSEQIASNSVRILPTIDASDDYLGDQYGLYLHPYLNTNWIHIDASDILSNDVLPSNNFEIVDFEVISGQMNISFDGSRFSLIPGTYVGPASFNYVISDGIEYGTATVSLNITTPNIVGTSIGEDLLGIEHVSNTISGEGGNDRVWGTNKNDTLYGGYGHDTLYAQGGYDSLYGNTGNDTLYGTGDTSYFFSAGDGQDEVFTEGNGNKVTIFGDIDASKIIRYDRGNDLILKFGDDSIHFHDFWQKDNSHNLYATIQSFTFNGETLSTNNEFLNQIGSDRRDTLTGSSGNDTLYSHVGDDTINGGSGSDLISGGLGNDILFGDSGDDTYYFESGFGHDIIDDSTAAENDQESLLFSTQVLESSISGSQSGSDLVLFSGTDSVRILNFFSAESKIDNAVFEGGGTWDRQALIDSVTRSNSEGLIVRQTDSSGDLRHFAYDSAGRKLFDINSEGIVSETRYDTSGRVSDRITYSPNISSQLALWIQNNPDEAAPSASDISGFFAEIAQSEGQYHQQLFANSDAHYDLDNRWQGDDTWGITDVIRDRRISGTVGTGTLESSALTQTLDLSAYDTSQSLMLGLGATHFSNSNLQSRWIIQFFDVDGDNLGAEISTNGVASGEWQDESFVFSIPDGAVSADVSLRSVVAQPAKGAPQPVTADTPIFFDNLRAEVFPVGDTSDFEAEPAMSEHTSFDYEQEAVVDNSKIFLFSDLVNSDFEAVSIDSVIGASAVNATISVNSTDKTITFLSADDFTGNASFDVVINDQGQLRTETILVSVGKSIHHSPADGDDYAGTAAADTVYGNTGNDTLHGAAKDDWIGGYGGNDTLLGDEGNDTLLGGIGNDTLYGGIGNDSLLGNFGTNHLLGEAGDDILTSGTGSDTLNGGLGSDLYIYSSGNGADIIDNTAADNDTSNDRLLIQNISAANTILSKGSSWGGSADDLVIKFINSETDSITIKDYFASGSPGDLDNIYFGGADSAIVWTRSDIEQAVTLIGTSANETIQDTDTNRQVLMGLGGADILQATLGGNDTIYGGDGNDQLISAGGGQHALFGEAGNDWLIGLAGDDYLSGGTGNDIYYFQADASDDDVINNNSSTWVDDTDQLNLFATNKDSTWFTQDGNDLLIEFVGEDSSVKVQGWFIHEANELDKVYAEGGQILDTSHAAFDQLIYAMAQHTDRSGIVGADGVAPVDDTNLTNAIAAAWQAA